MRNTRHEMIETIERNAVAAKGNGPMYHPDIFRCTCRECMTGYFAWCDSAPSTAHDASRWDRYDNQSIKDAAAARGYITNGDLLACGFSVNELRDPPRCTECGMSRNSLMFREYEAGTEWNWNLCCNAGRRTS